MKMTLNLLVLFATMNLFAQKTDKNDWFDSIESKDKVISIYDQQLQNLTFRTKELDVETSYGRTHILEAGDPDNPPLFLVHGTNASAPAVLEAFSDLEKSYHVYAVDVIGQPNKSNSTRLSMKSADYGIWMNEVFDALQLDNIRLVGISFGGFLCVKAASYREEKIKDIFLISSGGIAQGSLMKMYFEAFVPMKKFKKTQNDKHFQTFIDSSITDASDHTMNTMREILLHYKIDTTPIPKIKGNVSTKITKPIHIIASRNDMFFPGEKVIKRGKKLFPSYKGGLMLEDSKHVPSYKDTEKTINYILHSI